MQKKKRAVRFLTVFFVSLAVCLMVTGSYVRNKSQMERAQMEQLVLTRANKVNNVITKLLYKTQVLSALVIQSDGQVQSFERVAATIVDDPSIRNVILAPDGVVSHVYPLEGNEQVLGMDYFSEGEGNGEAVLARDTGQLVLGGPFNLVQGGQALVGRLPVYLNRKGGQKEFWGLVSVTLKFPQALENAELEQLKDQGFAYEIWRISPDTGKRQIIANSSYDYNTSAPSVEKPLSILNSEWYFRLSPIRPWYEYPETWLFTMASLVISWLIASLVMNNSELRQMQLVLEKLTYHDALTQSLNRRGLTRELEPLTRKPGEKFVLCYLDLNKFKMVNDTLGHGMGDQLLQQFASAFHKNMNHNHLFARIGGDEFILVLKNTDQKEEARQFLEKIQEELKDQALSVHSQSIQITYSIGMAVYPGDGEDLDILIGIADEAMYQEKMKGGLV